MNYKSVLLQPLYAPEGQPGAAAPEPAAPPPASGDDDEFQEEEVVIPGEEGAEPEPAPAADGTPPAAAPPKKRGPKRYAELNRRAQEAQSFAERVAAENQALRQRAEEAERKATEAGDMAMSTYAAKTTSDLSSAEKEYAEALSSNDTARITQATKALSLATTAHDDAQRFKAQKKPEPAPAAAPAAAPPAREEFQDAPEPAKNWMMDNRYFDMVARDDNGNVIFDRATGQPIGNRDFDRDMHAEAVLFSQKLERKIARGQVSYKSFSPEYFAEVDAHMREEFPDRFDEEEAPAAPPPRKNGTGSPVAAPGNRNLPGAPPRQGAQSYKLSADEVRFITKSVNNNAGPKYPKGHAKAFQPMSIDDAKVSFARRKMQQAKESGAA